MPNLLEVSYSDDAVTFVNPKNNKAEKLALCEVIEDIEAIRVVNAEIKGRSSVSHATVSLLAHLLNNARLDDYKGTTPANAPVPKELKAAIRDLETEYLKPIFSKPLVDKGNKPATVEKAWQDFATGLREGGGYANAKSRVVSYFAICGQLPIAPNGKLLTVAAIDKLLANAKAMVAPVVDSGIAGKLVALSLEIENRTEKTPLGELPDAIAALKSMLATYEGLYSEQLERMTSLVGNPDNNVQSIGASVVDTAKQEITENLESKKIEYTEKWENGTFSDVEYQIAMADIGYDVELDNSIEEALL